MCPPYSTREGGVVVAAAIRLVRPRRGGAREARATASTREDLGVTLDLSDTAALSSDERAASAPRRTSHAPGRSLHDHYPRPTRRPAPDSAAPARSTWPSWPPSRPRGATGPTLRERRRSRLPPRGESRRGSPVAGRTSSRDVRRIPPPRVSAIPRRRSSDSHSIPRSPRELERRMLLCYTGASRFSGATIGRVMQAYERGESDVTGALRRAPRGRRADGGGACAPPISRVVGALLERELAAPAGARPGDVHAGDGPPRGGHAERGAVWGARRPAPARAARCSSSPVSDPRRRRRRCVRSACACCRFAGPGSGCDHADRRSTRRSAATLAGLQRRLCRARESVSPSGRGR